MADENDVTATYVREDKAFRGGAKARHGLVPDQAIKKEVPETLPRDPSDGTGGVVVEGLSTDPKEVPRRRTSVGECG